MTSTNKRPYAGVVFPDEWNADEGLPDINAVAQAIQVWSILNPGELSVRQIGDIFNLDDAQVRQAVEAHYWMYLDGPDDDPTKQVVQHEGE